MWPSSRANPCAPCQIKPSTTKPQPIPLPTVIPATLPRPPRSQASARHIRLASLSQKTGRPSSLGMSSRGSVSTQKGRLGLTPTILPEFRSMVPGVPMPIAPRLDRPSSRAQISSIWRTVSRRRGKFFCRNSSLPKYCKPTLQSPQPYLTLEPPISSPSVALSLVNIS
ncbi:MAG: hypothetical protein BWX83_00777 [Candidatus Cloacimonetes bacterium ADurb.Bin117]|nr:MAG: hypothetical protein BWX83_00777 [Candidatus Cloacimonetes bacterium ADurb.Bin117]